MAAWEAVRVNLRNILTWTVVWLAFVAHQTGNVTAQTSTPKPNILFIILDDVGIDQLRAFNPASDTLTPVIDTLVHKGVAFNNCWMMPECSPSRACFFTGRYPVRNGVKSALLDYNLPSSQISPYEMTTPRVLAGAGYVSAMIGKYHLGGPSNNPAGIGGPTALGWNYFNGCLAGGPPFIDTTLGGRRRMPPCIRVVFLSVRHGVSAGFLGLKATSTVMTTAARDIPDRNAFKQAGSLH